jgi:O-antigen ligase
MGLIGKILSRPLFRAAPASGRGGGIRERLTFNFGPGTVPSQGALTAQPEATFATAPYAEPRDWGYAGLLAFTAVLLLRPQDQIPGLSALHLAELCAIVGLLPMLLHRFARRLPAFKVTPETLGLLALGFAMIATVPFSVWPGGALGVFTDYYVKLLLVFVLMINTLTTPRRLTQITWLIVVCSGYIAFLAVFNYARGINLVENGRLSGPVSGMFGNPNDMAMHMVTFFPAAVVTALTREHSTVRRLAAAGIGAMMLATIVFTQSRSGFIGLAFVLAALVVLGRRVRPGFAGMALAAVLFAAPFAPASFWSRMASIVDERQDAQQYTGSREARRIVMQEGVEVFLERPLTGVGAGQFKNYNPPGRKERWRETHNALIQVAAETGLVGLLAFAFLIVRAGMSAAATQRMLRRPRRRSAPDPLKLVLDDRDRQELRVQTVAMTAGFVGWFVCSLFASVAYNWTFYYLLALIVAGRELTRHRLQVALAFEATKQKRLSVPAAGGYRKPVARSA